MPPFSEDVVVVPSPCDQSFAEGNKTDGTFAPAVHHQRNESNTSTIETRLRPISPSAQRSVTFYPYGEVVDIDTLDEYTDEEIQACWYDEEELANIKSENNQSIRRIARGSQKADDCLRGLESQSHAGYLSSRKIKDSSIAAVLGEQYRQYQMGIDSPELIRESYQFFATYAGKRAVEAARYDALDALRIQRESCTASSQGGLAKLCWFMDPTFWFPRLMENAFVEL